VLFLHGGGYTSGHIDLFDGPVTRHVSASGVPMLSVEYRRAPGRPFPAPLEDACAALRRPHAHAAGPGVDPDRIGVPGDSAGGGMAAALTILARERGGPRTARRILPMPMPMPMPMLGRRPGTVRERHPASGRWPPHATPPTSSSTPSPPPRLTGP
jgi:acetyl esterase/lipase